MNAEELKRYDAYPMLIEALKKILMATTTMAEMQALREASALLTLLEEKL